MRESEEGGTFQGQPNAATGVCDEDVMTIDSGGTSFELCGWNSGQHGKDRCRGLSCLPSTGSVDARGLAQLFLEQFK
jgi:hypothetical protein